MLTAFSLALFRSFSKIYCVVILNSLSLFPLLFCFQDQFCYCHKHLKKKKRNILFSLRMSLHLYRKFSHSGHTKLHWSQNAFIKRTSSTFMLSFALVSNNLIPIWSANRWASSVNTTFLSGASFLFPTVKIQFIFMCFSFLVVP